MSSRSAVVCGLTWPQPSVTVGILWTCIQLASSPPLEIARNGARPSSATAASAASTQASLSFKRNDFVIEPAVDGHFAAAGRRR